MRLELTDPVSITCGHTFCRACIAFYWDTAQLQGYCCPECRRICPKDQLIPAYRLQHLVTKVQLAIEELDKQDKMVLENEAPASAVQLVYTDPEDKNRLKLDESAVQRYFLENEVADLPLCLICVTGEKRWGKSTLMNYILRALHSLESGQPVSLGELSDPLTGFEWSIGMDGLTKGIWMWKRPFILERDGNKMAVFVLDTEGSLDIENDRETSIKLSALSMLLSSYLIFNVNTNFGTSELDYLEMYLHVAEVVGESYSLQHLQHLDLLVQDWYDPNNCGKEAARMHLENTMEKLRNSSKHVRVLQTLNGPSVTGFLFPDPGLQFTTSKGRLADMDENFRSHLTTYISDLMGEIWHHCKSDTSGIQITCAQLGGYLKAFCIALNNEHYGFGSPMEMLKSLEEDNKLQEQIKREFQEFTKEESFANENRMNMDKMKVELQDFINKEAPSSSYDLLWTKPSEFINKVSDEAAILIGKYENSLKGEESENQQLVDELNTYMMQSLEQLYTKYSSLYKFNVSYIVTRSVTFVVLGAVVVAGIGTIAGKVFGTEAGVMAGAFFGVRYLGTIVRVTRRFIGHAIGRMKKKKKQDSKHEGKDTEINKEE